MCQNRLASGELACSGQQGLDHSAPDVSQPKVASALTVRKSLVVEALMVQHRRVQVADVDEVLDSLESELVRCAVA